MARSFTRVITTPAAARIPREWNRPFVSILSDWGVRDPSPAICRGVILGLSLIHISEPTRQAEISYAVFCLKKKKIFFFFFFNDTATTEIYTRSLVGSVRCV